MNTRERMGEETMGPKCRRKEVGSEGREISGGGGERS